MGNISYGIVAAINESQPETQYYEDYHGGGFKTVGLTVQFGLADFGIR